MEDFVRRFKVESRDVKRVTEVMRISGFMHGITNPELIKRLHDKNPEAILASSSEVPSVLEFLQRRKLEAKKEVAASEFSHLNHSLSHRPVSVKPDISKPDISKASSAGGKLHILKPSCERNGITLTPKESLSPTSGSKVPNSPLTGKNEESYKFPIAVQKSFSSLWSQDVRGDPDSDIGGHWRSSDSGPPHYDFSLMDILLGKSTRGFVLALMCWSWLKVDVVCFFVERQGALAGRAVAVGVGGNPSTEGVEHIDLVLIGIGDDWN
ncbi:hypothetical protein Tco_0783569 [Tanacetum coccineum]